MSELRLTEILRDAFAAWEQQCMQKPTRKDFDFHVKCTVKQIMVEYQSERAPSVDMAKQQNTAQAADRYNTGIKQVSAIPVTQPEQVAGDDAELVKQMCLAYLDGQHEIREVNEQGMKAAYKSIRPDLRTAPADGGECEMCEGKGWYGQQVHSSNAWEAEQVQCEHCHGTGKQNTGDEPVSRVSPLKSSDIYATGSGESIGCKESDRATLQQNTGDEPRETPATAGFDTRKELFEAWARESFMDNFSRGGHGYTSKRTNRCWRAYKAGWDMCASTHCKLPESNTTDAESQK